MYRDPLLVHDEVSDVRQSYSSTFAYISGDSIIRIP